jgi:predicted nucleotide-binding protein (sugar kinase/HSP70/actin superfamily)
VDTIFEIGGQDSKFIAIEQGVVVDFSMNEACAAGTGSFLEEQAEKLGIRIKDEFARMALASPAPVRLGERCTVFMERDVTAALHAGAERGDLVAGLAYSIVFNYLNRVVRGRRIGDVIFFQGGTAYNDAVAAAFSQVLGKTIIVPPHNGVIGAIGMALIARERYQALRRPSRFRGYDLSRTTFTTREFVCKACSNYCDMKEVTVEGQKTYWGDKCSDKFRRRARTELRPVIPDLVALREAALLDGYRPANGQRPRIGIPRAMFFFDRFPFWNAYLKTLGFGVVLSGVTDGRTAAQGAELAVAQPCFPVQLAHGHVKEVLNAGADYALVPNAMDEEAPPWNGRCTAYLCPWNQTLPFVVRAAPGLEHQRERILSPTVHFRNRNLAKRELARAFAPLGVSRRESDRAAEAGWRAQAAFHTRLQEAGRQALDALKAAGAPAVVVVGRPYNLYDRNGNCDLLAKLRLTYGVNVLPYDFLPVDSVDVGDVNANMYWHSGRRILAAGRLARQAIPAMNVIYVTNFKCGPDSFLKHFLHLAAAGPYLTLQFDGHGNDAGYMTRCEAYLDSKGLLRCYQRSKAAAG